MIDFAKLYCKIHPYELITNFCKKDCCLVGLCATCVCSHTQQHIDLGTSPDYQNIRSTFSEMHKNVRQCIQQFESDKLRINLLRSNIEKKKTVIRDRIQDSRNTCLQMVNQHFDDYSKEVQKIVTEQSIKNGYHDNYRLDSVSALINKEITSLIQCSQELNSVSFLDSSKRIRKQVLKESKHTHDEFTQQLQKNQQFEPSIQHNENAAEQLRNSLKKMMSIRFKYPGLKNSLALNQIPTQKSITEHGAANENKLNNSITFQNIPTIVTNASEIMNRSFEKSPQMLYLGTNGSLVRSNSSLAIQRGISPTKNNVVLVSQNNWRQAPLNHGFNQPLTVVKNNHNSLDSKNRPVSMNSSFTNFTPKNSFVFTNSSHLNQSNINKKTRFNFQPQYTEFKQNDALKLQHMSNVENNGFNSNNSMMKRSCSKKGIKLCSNSQLMSQASRQDVFGSTFNSKNSNLIR